MKRVIILQIVLLASVAAAATDANLVGWWKFDEGAGTVAYDSAGHNNGTLNGNPQWGAGQVGGAIDCDGNGDYVRVPDNDSLTPSNEITIAYWLYNRVGGSGVYKLAWCSDSRAYAFDAGTNAHLVVCQTRDAIDEMLSIGTVSLNQWHYFAATFDHGQASLYIDGQLDSTKMLSVTSIMNDAQPLIIGGYWEYCTPAFINSLNGRIDDVRIYNRALSTDEIQQLYESSFPALTNLEIIGPNEVAEESTAAYKAVAHYDNGATKDVTALAEWRAEPNIVATIEAGQLTTGQALYPKHNIKIYADYTEEQTTVDAEKQISVFAVCPQGNALQFDGVNDYVDVPDSTSLRFTQYNSFSICLWVKPVSTGYFLSKMRGHGQRSVFGYQASWNSIADCFSFVIDQSYIMNTIVSTPIGSAPAGSWYHVAYVYDKKNMKIFLDGQLGAAGVFTGNTGNTSPDKNLALGTRSVDSVLEMYFKGELDDVRIYNRVLSADEIQTIMHAKPIGSDPNLVAYWDFDEGAGQTAADVSGHGNNGTLGSSNGIDTADPCWVESDAPVGKCTTEQVMLRNLLGATDDKKAANQLIADAKAKERASVQLITDLQKQMNGTEKMNATRAKAQISVAIVQEETASRQIDATIKRLEDALLLLNYEVDSNSGPTLFPPWRPWPGVNNKTNAPNRPSSYGNKPTVKAISLRLR